MNDDAIRAWQDWYSRTTLDQRAVPQLQIAYEAGWRAHEAQAAVPRYQIAADGTVVPLDGPLRERGDALAQALRTMLWYATDSMTVPDSKYSDAARAALGAWPPAAAVTEETAP